ncbi:MAG: DUF4129 domain-containing protein [Promethearchaeota archaeon]
MAAKTTDQRRMGAMTVISSLILVAMIVWAGWSFALVSLGLVRDYDPHIEYDEAPHFGYDIPWAGGQTDWWNYTYAPLNETFPDDILDQLDNVLFYVAPEDPPQLWRSTAYDEYDGSSWAKTDTTQWSVGDGNIDSSEATNEIYRVYLNVTTGPATEPLEIPTLFPNMKIIRGSFETGYIDQSGVYQAHSPSKLTSYDISTDEYGTALLNPFFEGSGEDILLSYEVTYDNQDLITVQSSALDGDQAPPDIWNLYSPVGVTLSANVVGNASQFIGAGNAYQTAVQVEQFFRSNFSLILDDYTNRPGSQEVTDWFLERGGGLPMDFVTAYCVFMRYLGVPARPTLGYAVGNSMGGYREIQVRHMLFWAEVFIPMSGHPNGGEWIQVIPLPLPGTGGVPNTGQGNVQLLLASSLFPDMYELIGTPFQIYAAIFVNGVPITTPETIDFFDRTDSVVMGSAAIQPSGIATLDYAFPAGSSVGMHNITATYYGPTYVVSNWTAIYAVSQPNPRYAAAEPESGFFPSEEIDIDIKQGLDTYIAYWNDTLDIRGNMTDSEGNGVDGTTLNNPWMQIMWDDQTLGSALILSNGSYRYLMYIDPANATLMGLMSPGAHELWSSYSGEYDPFPPYYPIYLPARSSDNSTVTIFGAATSNLVVTPNPAYRGATLHYEGTLQLFDGTILSFETVDFYFNGAYLDSRVTDATGFFQYDFPIPLAHALGWFDANVTWSSPSPDIVNMNDNIPVEIRLRPTDLSDMAYSTVFPGVVHITENITIYGHLLDGVNGTGLVGRTVDFWWDDGTSAVQVGSNVTEAGGWYQFTYTVPAGFEGYVDLWVNFISLDGYYDNSQSPIRSVEVKKWDVQITLEPIPDPLYILDTVAIEGVVTFSEIPWPFSNANISIWWNNQTDGLRQIGWAITNSTGGYSFYYVIPAGHEPGNVTIYASFESPYFSVASAESSRAYPDIQTRPTILTVGTVGGFRVYYINETVYIVGQLLDGGIPIVGEDVTIYWDNGTLQSFVRTTNSTGYYNLTYPLSLSDGVGTIAVSVDYAGGGLYDPAFTVLMPDITTQLYQTDITAMAINGTYHLDEVLYYSGQLTFPHNGNPIPGATVIIHFVDGNGERTWPKFTDGSGWFSFQYNFTLADLLGGIMIWSEYTSTDPLWSDANSGSQSANVELYQLELNAFAPGFVYLDQGVFIDGWLTYLGGAPPLVGEVVDVYISGSAVGPWSYIGSDTTDATGYFSYTHFFMVPPDSEGDYYFLCVYNSTSPLNADAVTGAMQVTALRYQVTLDMFLSSNPIYQNETLTISAHLYFTINGTNISGAAIRFYWFNGTLGRLDSVPIQTNASGWAVLVYSRMSMDTIRTGIEVYVYYDGSFLLLPGESSHETLTLWQWRTVISGFSTGAASYYILQTIPITGQLTYVVGPYAIGGVSLNILVDGAPVGNTFTASNGSFSFNWPIPESATPGTHQIRVQFLSPMNWVAGYTTPPSLVDFLQYTVDLTATIDTYTIFRGSSGTISGSLAFTNGTPMVGYQVAIHWVNNTGDWTVATITITDLGGAFAYIHDIGWGHDVGDSGYYVQFVRPNAAFQAASTTPEIVKIWDLVTLSLGSVPGPQFARGDQITISGTVSNGGGGVAGVLIDVFDDGIWAGSDASNGIGIFSVDYTFPDDHPRGLFYVTLDVQPGSYYMLSGPADSWLLEMYISSTTIVTIPQLVDYQPGEPFTFSAQLIDDDDLLEETTTIRVYLNTTFLFQRGMAPGDWNDIPITIPSDWTTSGLYQLVVECYGNDANYVLGSTGIPPSNIHIFTAVDFDFEGTPRLVNLATDFSIVVAFRDDLGIPIRIRNAIINVNGTEHLVSTQSSGVIEMIQTGIDQEATIDVFVTLTSLDSGVPDEASETFQIRIQPPGIGFPNALDLLLPLAVIGAAVAVLLLYLYFVRGFGKGAFVSVARDLASKLRSIKRLADAGKYAAAISLTYHTFEDMCASKTGQPRRYSETARDYVTRILKEIPLDSSSVNELLQAYEEARFSHHEITEETYDGAMRVFTDLYPRIDAVPTTE